MAVIEDSNLKTNFANRLAMFQKSGLQNETRTAKVNPINKISLIKKPEEASNGKIEQKQITQITQQSNKIESKDENKQNTLRKINEENKQQPEKFKMHILDNQFQTSISQEPKKSENKVETKLTTAILQNEPEKPSVKNQVNKPPTTDAPKPTGAKQSIQEINDKPKEQTITQPQKNSDASSELNSHKPISTNKFSNLMNIFNKVPEQSSSRMRSNTTFINPFKNVSSIHNPPKQMIKEEEMTKVMIKENPVIETKTQQTQSSVVNLKLTNEVKQEPIPNKINEVKPEPLLKKSNPIPINTQVKNEVKPPETTVNRMIVNTPKEDIKNEPLQNKPILLNYNQPKVIEAKPMIIPRKENTFNPPEVRKAQQPITTTIEKPKDTPAPNKMGSLLAMFEKGGQKPVQEVKPPVKVKTEPKSIQSIIKKVEEPKKETTFAQQLNNKILKPQPIQINITSSANIINTSNESNKSNFNLILEKQVKFGSLRMPNQMPSTIQCQNDDKKIKQSNEVDLRNEKPIISKRKSVYIKNPKLFIE